MTRSALVALRRFVEGRRRKPVRRVRVRPVVVVARRIDPEAIDLGVDLHCSMQQRGLW